MPLTADTSSRIKWPLGIPKKPFKKNNVLTEKNFYALQKILKDLDWGPGSETKYHTMSGRWATNPEITQEIEQELLELAKTSWNEPDLKQNFIFAVRYQKQEDVVPYLWEHLDDTSSQFMIDLCVEKHELNDWGLNIENIFFSEEENSAVFFNGQQHVHGRPPYPSTSDTAYLIAFFAIYSKPGDWAYDLNEKNLSKEEFTAIAKEYAYDADVRFLEAKGYSMYFNDLPEKNYPCVDCQECYVSDTNKR